MSPAARAMVRFLVEQCDRGALSAHDSATLPANDAKRDPPCVPACMPDSAPTPSLRRRSKTSTASVRLVLGRKD